MSVSVSVCVKFFFLCTGTGLGGLLGVIHFGVLRVPVGAPRFWPGHGISWEFFLALYMYEKHWETIFFHFGACHFVPFDI